jgi:hypothetical protein
MTASKASSNSTTTVQRSKETVSIPDKRLGRMITLRENSLPGSNNKNSFLVKEAIADLRCRIFSGEDMGSFFTSLVDTIYNLIRLSEEYWALDGSQLVCARELGIISHIPNNSTSEIEDKSKSDFLVKFLAVIHAGGQIVQLIWRWAEGLPSSQMEVATVGFSLCAPCT